MLTHVRAGILNFEMNPENHTTERRASSRMSIERDVQYKLLNRGQVDAESKGKTLNISSSGVLFTTEQVMIPGRRVEVAIDWPAQLNNKCALKLVARGRIVRFEGVRAALEILQHEFRTRGSRARSGNETRRRCGSTPGRRDAADGRIHL